MPFNLVSGFKAKYIQPKIDKKMNEAGQAFVAEARRLVPKDTHQTENSIGYTYRQSDMQLICHVDTSWAIYLELGTSKMAPRPFMRPAMNAISAIWRGSVQLSFPNAPEKHIAKAQNHAYRLKKGANLQIGRGKNQ